MQDKYSFVELHGINRAVGAAGIVFNDLKPSGAAKTPEHLRGIVLITGLGKGKCVTEDSPYVGGQCHQVLVAAAYPFERLLVVAHCPIILEQVYRASAGNERGAIESGGREGETPMRSMSARAEGGGPPPPSAEHAGALGSPNKQGASGVGR